MFPYELLRRYPDAEAKNLFAVDAADRLLIDTAAPVLDDRRIAIIGDNYGAITLAALHHGARDIRVHQDSLVSELALAANAARLDSDIAAAYTHYPLNEELVRDAQIVLMRLPRSLDALAEMTELISRHARRDVTVYASGMIKHMTPAMNTVIAKNFTTVTASLARQKARVLTAALPVPPDATRWPTCTFDNETGLWVCAHGGVFSGSTIDIGTRFLLSVCTNAVPDASKVIDLGCGTGILATSLAVQRPSLHVIASDCSAAAVASARATAVANHVADQITVVRDDALSLQPDSSADLILLNPPFHSGSAVHTGIAHKLFADAGRVIAPDGEVWSVWNSHLNYWKALEKLIGPTKQIARNTKFTVTASTKRSQP